MRSVLLPSALLGVSAPALGMAPERKAAPERVPTAEAVVGGTRPAWDYEVFARGELAAIPANGEVAWAGAVLDPLGSSWIDISHGGVPVRPDVGLGEPDLG